MEMGKWGYFADFVLYPVLIAALATRALWGASLAVSFFVLATIVAGAVAWSGLEYTMHRWVLHRIEPFRRLHDRHHARPVDLIGTPAWLSGALFLSLWQLLAHREPGFVAAGLVTGLMLGYLAYAALHHAVHHRRARPGSWLHRAKQRHARHHMTGGAINFGVSVAVWDRMLGTEHAGDREPLGTHA
jgi:sterol desaturase/sphingolipid hydroxylase (fatty acid hydroxylase superfamily)